MAKVALTRMRDDQLPGVLELLEASGATPRSPELWAQDQMTALLLGEPPVAAMPMARRSLQVSPGRELKVGWISSNLFHTTMGFRRQAASTQNLWPDLLPELDALVCIRRDPPTRATRWYNQVDFHPVLSIRCHYLELEEPPAAPTGRYHLSVVTGAEIGAWQSQMHSVHQDVFNAYGGYIPRSSTYWDSALRWHFYRHHYQFQVVGLWNAQTLMGYALVGWSDWHSSQPRMDILELATRQWDAHVAHELIQTTKQLAWSKGVMQVRAVVSVHDPYRPHLIRMGFEDRWGYWMLLKWLRPQRYLDALTGIAPALGDLGLQMQAPGAVPVSLAGSASRRMMRLQADATTLARLWLQRLELSAAVHEGSVLPLDGGDSELARVAMALPWTPWVFHMLDFI